MVFGFNEVLCWTIAELNYTLPQPAVCSYSCERRPARPLALGPVISLWVLEVCDTWRRETLMMASL